MWTLAYIDGGGATQEVSFPALAALEGGQVVGDAWSVQFETHKASTLTLRLPGVPAHVAPAIPFESRVTIYSGRTGAPGSYTGGTKQFQGLRVDRAGNSSARSSATYTFADEFYFLEHLPFYQTWTRVTNYTTGATTTYPFTNIILFQPNPGQTYSPAPINGHIHTGQMIKDILNWAISQGANLQVGTINPANYCAWYPVQNVKCSEALRMCLRLHPDCFTEIDYSTTPPTFNVRSRGNLTAVPLPYAYTDSDGRRHQATDIQPRPELIPKRVAIFYRILDGGYLLATPSDIYPAAATTGLRALDFAVDLQGPRSAQTTAALVSAAFNPTNLAWWQTKVPSLKPVAAGGQLPDSGAGTLALLDSTINGGGGHLKGITVVDATGANVDLTTYAYELDPKSSVLSWMGVNVVEATVTAFFSYTKSTACGGSTVTDKILEHKHHVRVKLVDTASQTFRHSEYLTTGEQVPPNLAQSLYTALSVLQYNLTHTVVEKPFNGWIKPGKHAVNLTGALAAAAWTTMNATVVGTNYKLHADGAGNPFANFSVRCGPVEHLEAGELIRLFNLFQNRDLTKMDTGERSSGNPNAGSNVTMPSDAARENSLPAPPVFSQQNYYAPDASDATRSFTMQSDATTGRITVAQQSASAGTNYTTGVITPEYSGAGAPTAATLATNAYYRVGDRYADTTAKTLYRCTTAGDKTGSVWALMSGAGAVWL